MSVLMPNDRLGVRRRVEDDIDSHGERRRKGWGEMIADLAPGRTRERSDGGWTLAVDPIHWPVRKGDLIVSDTGHSWLVNNAQRNTNNVDSRVDYVTIDASQRTPRGTEPIDSWFVGRYADSVDDSGSGPVDVPIIYQAGVWTGHGLPPETGAGWNPEPGDEYIDLDTGIIYQLGED